MFVLPCLTLVLSCCFASGCSGVCCEDSTSSHLELCCASAGMISSEGFVPSLELCCASALVLSREGFGVSNCVKSVCAMNASEQMALRVGAGVMGALSDMVHSNDAGVVMSYLEGLHIILPAGRAHSMAPFGENAYLAEAVACGALDMIEQLHHVHGNERGSKNAPEITQAVDTIGDSLLEDFGVSKVTLCVLCLLVVGLLADAVLVLGDAVVVLVVLVLVVSVVCKVRQ